MIKPNYSKFVIVDKDQNIFNVIESPGRLDWWHDMILDEQKRGRDITGYPSAKELIEIIKDQERNGNTFSRNSLLKPVKK